MKAIEVCDECTQNCVLIHGQKKDPSSVVLSFLKLLYGNYDFSKFLYLPPEVSRKMSALCDQQNYDLEDSNGQRWTVTLANINNGLALDKGWHKFFTDHGLREGDTLIFNYIIGSHFVVQIYGKTGCQKLNFPEANGNQRKRSKTKGKFRSEDGILNENPVSMEVAGCEPHAEVVAFAKIQTNNITSLREKVATIDKDHQIGHPSVLLKKSAVKNEKSRINSATTSKIVKCPVSAYRNKHSSEIMKVCKTELMEMNKMSSCKSMNSGQDPKFFNELGQSSIWAEKGETMKVRKKELMEMNKMSGCKRKDPKFFYELDQSSSRAEKDNGEVFKVVKTEPVYSFNAYSPDTSNNSCLAVVGSQVMLELPQCLPSISFRRANRKVVILRGPNTIFWPVLYHEKYGLKALASGWEAFCKSNSLHPGDECVFELENGPDSIYSVNIVRN